MPRCCSRRRAPAQDLDDTPLLRGQRLAVGMIVVQRDHTLGIDAQRRGQDGRERFAERAEIVVRHPVHELEQRTVEHRLGIEHRDHVAQYRVAGAVLVYLDHHAHRSPCSEWHEHTRSRRDTLAGGRQPVVQRRKAAG
jgi:hypothetical protein